MSIDIEAACVLITGGGSGIGLGLARRFLEGGARVTITGRDRARLERVAADHPGLDFVASDIADPCAREALAEQVRESMPALNVLINNAGIQRRIGLAEDDAPWAQRQAEIDTLLSGPIHLNHLLLPLLLSERRAATIVNLSSGGAYVPQPFAPVYSASKAALHSYTMNLRFALRHTACSVVELIPPAVRTSLAGDGAVHGVDLEVYCDAVFVALVAGDADEIGYGPTASAAFEAAKAGYRAMFDTMAGRFPVKRYE
ncbi:SDR family NAD(P)-dependent oxidoreductase [Burkholderia gladioli]|uniref:SDR family NAD(P)-dependent oxidoreductase n=1 Tax=Burkholderia gladioli TaxID=28095 RepID=UPI001641DE06|nr:SDR family NAD(P)-dependent oxidoreductase [Burkholderia gladioli]